MLLRPRQEQFVQRIRNALEVHGNTLGIAPTGAGKCLGRGTPVLMFDGSIKAVEDVRVGDVLMGPDSGPRRVLSVCSGREPLYQVTPTKGASYVVNESHILSLRITPGATKHNCSRSTRYRAGQIHNIGVLDYLKASETFRHCAKGWRVGVEFPPAATDLPLPPYFFGLWLGDGHSRGPAITTADTEVVDYVRDVAKVMGLSVRVEGAGGKARSYHLTTRQKGGRNHARTALVELGVFRNKHIPHRYKTASRADRLKLLAGLVDSDGYLTRGGYALTFKSRALADDVAFLARSLGLAAYTSDVIKTCTNSKTRATAVYRAVSISGDCAQVPVRLKRRMAGVRRQKKDVLSVGINVSPIGVGDYFGFEIDGDRLFLLSDFTVTHNTVMLSACIDYAGGERALILQHRDELVTQNRRTFHRFHKGASSGVIDGEQKQYGNEITFAMVQTLARDGALERLKPVDTLAIDEAHHVAAGSWLKIVERCRDLNPKVRLLGLTATPERADRKSLRVAWDNVADQISIGELIGSGHLIAPRTFVVDVGTQADLRGVKKSMAEYDMSAVEQIMDKVAVNEDVVRHWRDTAGDRSTVVFCSTIEHAKHVCEAFRQAGVSAEVVSQETSNREAVLGRFDKGEIQVICNVMVLTEGWDCQRVSCVVLLRPSSHKSTMIQMIGRGLRPVDPERYPGVRKHDCIILDFGISTLQHGSLETDAVLDPERAKGEARTKECPSCRGTVPLGVHECPLCGHEFISEDTAPKERGALTGFGMVEVDLLNASPFRYVDLWEDGSSLMATSFDAWGLVMWFRDEWHAIGGSETGGVRHLAAGEKVIALAAADEHMREHGDKKAAAKSKTWLSLPATDKQLQYLGIPKIEALGLNRYTAACKLTWKFSERVIQAKLMGAAS